MISYYLIAAAIIIPSILAILMVTSLDKAEVKNYSSINIQLIREEMRTVSFNVVENVGSERRDTLFINNDGVVLFNSETDGKQERTRLDSNELAKIRALILESGLMYIQENEFNKSSKELFTRYTLLVSVDSNSKRFQWVEDTLANEPSDVPPLLIYTKDRIYCITGKAELYSISCS